jgi:VanZ family protein
MRRPVFLPLLAAYLVLVLWLTLRPGSGAGNGPILVPLLDTWTQMRDGGNRVALTEVIGNVLLFIPLGYLLPAAIRALRSFGATLAVGAAIAVLIETSQWLFGVGRSPSIDDVIYNTTGAGIGAALFVLLTGLWRHHRDRAAGMETPSSSASGRGDRRREELVKSED